VPTADWWLQNNPQTTAYLQDKLWQLSLKVSLWNNKKPSCGWGTVRRGHASWNLVSCCRIRLGLTKTDHMSAWGPTLRSIHVAATEVNWTKIALNMLRAKNCDENGPLGQCRHVINITIVSGFDRTLLITVGLYRSTVVVIVGSGRRTQIWGGSASELDGDCSLVEIRGLYLLHLHLASVGGEPVQISKRFLT